MTAGELVAALEQAGAVTRGCIAAESATRLPLEAVVAPNKLNRWQRALKPALQKSKSGVHPWHEFEIHKRPTELVTRWDYDAAKDSWESSETLVKMEDVSFARGAMRECYRMKKMSQVGATPPIALVITRRHTAPSLPHRCSLRPRSISSSHLYARHHPAGTLRHPPLLQVNAHFFYTMDWKDCNNYVAKRYIARETPRDTYFNDIKMQVADSRGCGWSRDGRLTFRIAWLCADGLQEVRAHVQPALASQGETVTPRDVPLHTVICRHTPSLALQADSPTPELPLHDVTCRYLPLLLCYTRLHTSGRRLPPRYSPLHTVTYIRASTSSTPS